MKNWIKFFPHFVLVFLVSFIEVKIVAAKNKSQDEFHYYSQVCQNPFPRVECLKEPTRKQILAEIEQTNLRMPANSPSPLGYPSVPPPGQSYGYTGGLQYGYSGPQQGAFNLNLPGFTSGPGSGVGAAGPYCFDPIMGYPYRIPCYNNINNFYGGMGNLLGRALGSLDDVYPGSNWDDGDSSSSTSRKGNRYKRGGRYKRTTKSDRGGSDRPTRRPPPLIAAPPKVTAPPPPPPAKTGKENCPQGNCDAVVAETPRVAQAPPRRILPPPQARTFPLGPRTPAIDVQALPPPPCRLQPQVANCMGEIECTTQEHVNTRPRCKGVTIADQVSVAQGAEECDEACQAAKEKARQDAERAQRVTKASPECKPPKLDLYKGLKSEYEPSDMNEVTLWGCMSSIQQLQAGKYVYCKTGKPLYSSTAPCANKTYTDKVHEAFINVTSCFDDISPNRFFPIINTESLFHINAVHNDPGGGSSIGTAQISTTSGYKDIMKNLDQYKNLPDRCNDLKEKYLKADKLADEQDDLCKYTAIDENPEKNLFLGALIYRMGLKRLNFYNGKLQHKELKGACPDVDSIIKTDKQREQLNALAYNAGAASVMIEFCNYINRTDPDGGINENLFSDDANGFMAFLKTRGTKIADSMLTYHKNLKSAKKRAGENCPDVPR